MVYITYTMATQDLPDIYAQAREPQARVYNYIRQIPSGHGITIKCTTLHGQFKGTASAIIHI